MTISSMFVILCNVLLQNNLYIIDIFICMSIICPITLSHTSQRYTQGQNMSVPRSPRQPSTPAACQDSENACPPAIHNQSWLYVPSRSKGAAAHIQLRRQSHTHPLTYISPIPSTAHRHCIPPLRPLP